MELEGRTYKVVTLGCKVNQVEGAYLKEVLEALGAREAARDQRADLCVLNTCSVTAKASAEARKLLRKLLHDEPLLVVVTGCYAQVMPEEVLRAAEGPVLVLGHDEKFELEKLLRESPLSSLKRQIFVSSNPPSARAHTPLKRFPGRARAFLRIQDGCSAHCAYCIVPLARGPSRSIPEELILEQAKRFLEAGYRELVITGIHLGAWGRDLVPQRRLVELLKSLELLGSFRMRLSSLEVTEVTEELLDWAQRSTHFCHHFHIPLQSGDDAVLRAMGRSYEGSFYLEVLREVRRRFPDAAIGADVLVGFPTETEEAFRNTLNLLKESPVTYLHVFPYSPRPKTKAFSLKPLPAEVVEARASALRRLANEKKKRFYESQKGKVLEVLVESVESSGLLKGTSRNYIPVLFKGPKELKGEVVEVRVETVKDLKVYGKLITES